MSPSSTSPPQSSSPAFDDVYKGYILQASFEKTREEHRFHTIILYGTMIIQGQLRQVVAKMFRVGGNVTVETATRRTCREFKAWKAMSHSGCKNINYFHGVVILEHEQAVAGIPAIVTDYVQHDSLNYIQEHAHREFQTRLNIVLQLADGISFMHSRDVVHGDIKPDNFRISEDNILKIIDLGLSRYQTSSRTGETTDIHPSYRFIAPELIEREKDAVSMSVTKATDVYAFSMTALQILDGRGQESVPFKRCRLPFAVKSDVIKEKWPEQGDYDGISASAWRVISKCWTNDPSSRPSIDQVLQDLVSIG